MRLSDQALDALLKRLHLANTRRAWRELARRAEQENWTYHDFLALLVNEEIAHRQQTRLERVVRRARFPFLKTIDDFDFQYQSQLRLSLLGSYLSPDFVSAGRSRATVCTIRCSSPRRTRRCYLRCVTVRSGHFANGGRWKRRSTHEPSHRIMSTKSGRRQWRLEAGTRFASKADAARARDDRT